VAEPSSLLTGENEPMSDVPTLMAVHAHPMPRLMVVVTSKFLQIRRSGARKKTPVLRIARRLAVCKIASQQVKVGSGPTGGRAT
jgi:hypothetical protein